MSDIEQRSLVRALISRKNSMTQTLVNWQTHWQDATNLVLPRKKDIFPPNMTPLVAGEKKREKIFETTGVHSNVLLGSALHTMLTSANSLFFDFTSGDEEIDNEDSVRLWMQDSVRRMHNVLNNSNFHTEIHEAYLDLGSLGTTFVRMEEDDESVVRFHSRPIYEALIAENSKAVIDTVYRSYSWTMRQVVQEFGEDKLSDTLKRKLLATPHERIQVTQAVFPKAELSILGMSKKDLKGTKRFKFASITFIEQDEVILKISGFNEWPFIISRWSKISGEVYGRSPAMMALPEIKMIQEVAQVTIQAAQLTIRPPLQMPDEGFLMPIRTSPGGLNFYRPGTDTIKPLNTGANPELGEKYMDSIRVKIRQAFFIDQLQLNEGPQMTATEVLQRTEEKLRLLGPVLGRQHFELLVPLVERLFGIMLRKQMFKPIPEILSDRKLDVKFTSLIAKAQKSIEIEQLNQTINAIAPIVQADPSAMENFDSDRIVRDVAKFRGLPQEWIKPLDEVKAFREAQAEAAQKEQESQDALGAAEVVNKVAPALQEG